MSVQPEGGERAGLGCCAGSRESVSAIARIRSEAALRELLERDDTIPTSDLLDLLDERHPLYAELGSPAVVRLRGALLGRLAARPLDTAALPFLLEELESAHDAYLTAVAASVLRRATDPDPALVKPLLSALIYIRNRDEAVELDVYGGYGGSGATTTAMAEVLRTIAWLGGAGHAALPRLRDLLHDSPDTALRGSVADAIAAIEAEPAADRGCCASTSAAASVPTASPADLLDLEFEDQDGERVSFGAFFVGKPTIVVFFYTRCENEAKCPLTITNLGRLQRRLRRQGLGTAIRTAGITYDPGFDLPERLEQYRRSWGAERGPDHRLLRTTCDIDPVLGYFELGVNYVSRVVNRHQLEAYVLDPAGRVAAAVTRRRWNEDELIEHAKALREA